MPWFVTHCFFGFFRHLTERGRQALSSAWWRFTQMIIRLRHMTMRENGYKRPVEHQCVCCDEGKPVAILKRGSLVKTLNEQISCLI